MRDGEQREALGGGVEEKGERDPRGRARPLPPLICMQEGGRGTGGSTGTDDLGLTFQSPLSQRQSPSAF